MTPDRNPFSIDSLPEPLKPLARSFLTEPSSGGPIIKRDHQDLKEEVLKALSKLTPREQEVLNRRFGLLDGLVRTLNQTAQEISVSRSTVIRTQRSALIKLKDPVITQSIRGYFAGLSQK